MGPEAQSKDPDTAVCDHVASRRSDDNVLSMLLKTNREINPYLNFFYPSTPGLHYRLVEPHLPKEFILYLLVCNLLLSGTFFSNFIFMSDNASKGTS